MLRATPRIKILVFTKNNPQLNSKYVYSSLKKREKHKNRLWSQKEEKIKDKNKIIVQTEISSKYKKSEAEIILAGSYKKSVYWYLNYNYRYTSSSQNPLMHLLHILEWQKP